MLDIFDELTRMEQRISKRDWTQLEETYRTLCVANAGEEHASKIAAVNLTGFMRKLGSAFSKAVAKAKRSNAKAIYYEYDMDNGWHSAFFICQDYTPGEEKDDDWASDWDATIKGPASSEMAALYKKHDFSGSDIASSSTLYLVARTVAALGRCVDDHQTRGELVRIPVCIGFHDQNMLYRLLE